MGYKKGFKKFSFMNRMFLDCHSFKSLPDISKWILIKTYKKKISLDIEMKNDV